MPRRRTGGPRGGGGGGRRGGGRNSSSGGGAAGRSSGSSGGVAPATAVHAEAIARAILSEAEAAAATDAWFDSEAWSARVGARLEELHTAAEAEADLPLADAYSVFSRAATLLNSAALMRALTGRPSAHLAAWAAAGVLAALLHAAPVRCEQAASAGAADALLTALVHDCARSDHALSLSALHSLIRCAPALAQRARELGALDVLLRRAAAPAPGVDGDAFIGEEVGSALAAAAQLCRQTACSDEDVRELAQTPGLMPLVVRWLPRGSGPAATRAGALGLLAALFGGSASEVAMGAGVVLTARPGIVQHIADAVADAHAFHPRAHRDLATAACGALVWGCTAAAVAMANTPGFFDGVAAMLSERPAALDWCAAPLQCARVCWALCAASDKLAWLVMLLALQPTRALLEARSRLIVALIARTTLLRALATVAAVFAGPGSGVAWEPQSMFAESLDNVKAATDKMLRITAAGLFGDDGSRPAAAAVAPATAAAGAAAMAGAGGAAASGGGPGGNRGSRNNQWAPCASSRDGGGAPPWTAANDADVSGSAGRPPSPGSELRALLRRAAAAPALGAGDERAASAAEEVGAALRAAAELCRRVPAAADAQLAPDALARLEGWLARGGAPVVRAGAARVLAELLGGARGAAAAEALLRGYGVLEGVAAAVADAAAFEAADHAGLAGAAQLALRWRGADAMVVIATTPGFLGGVEAMLAAGAARPAGARDEREAALSQRLVDFCRASIKLAFLLIELSAWPTRALREARPRLVAALDARAASLEGRAAAAAAAAAAARRGRRGSRGSAAPRRLFSAALDTVRMARDKMMQIDLAGDGGSGPGADAAAAAAAAASTAAAAEAGQAAGHRSSGDSGGGGGSSGSSSASGGGSSSGRASHADSGGGAGRAAASGSASGAPLCEGAAPLPRPATAAAAAEVRRRCFACGREDGGGDSGGGGRGGTDGAALLQCAGCKGTGLKTFFCGRECLRAGWKAHKPDCEAARQRRGSGSGSGGGGGGGGGPAA